MSSNLSISDQLTKLDPERVLLSNSPSWHENERNMKITGVALIAIGAACALLGVASLVVGAMGISVGALPAAGLIGVGVGGIALSIAAVATGIFLLNKSYWNDQSYVDKQSFHAMKMSFDDVVNTYGWEHISSGHLLSNKAIRTKFFDKIEQLDYTSIIDQHRQQILEHRFISFSELKPKLIQEAQNLTASTFKATYGDQPLIDGVLTQEDDFFVAMIKRAIGDLPYHTIAKDYKVEREKNIITSQDIAHAIRTQCANKSFFTIYQEQGSELFWNILEDDILPPEFFKEAVLQEESSVHDLLERYSWKLFSHRIVKGQDLRQKFLLEIQNLTFSQIIERYSWQVIDTELATRQDLAPYALRECEGIATFEQIVERFGNNLFTKWIVTAQDPIIQTKVRSLCERIPFCTLMDTYKDILVPYALIPYNIHALVAEKNALDARLQTKRREAEQAYEECYRVARAAKKASLASSFQIKQSARVAITNENNTYSQNLSRIQGQIDQERKAHRRTIKALQSQNPPANCDAENNRHSDAIKSLDHTRRQEKRRHDLQIIYLLDNKRSASRFYREQVLAQEALCNTLISQAEQAKRNHLSTAESLHDLERKALNARFLMLLG